MCVYVCVCAFVCMCVCMCACMCVGVVTGYHQQFLTCLNVYDLALSYSLGWCDHSNETKNVLHMYSYSNIVINCLGMKQPIIIIVIVVLVEFTSGNYPNCVDCPEGEILC